MRLVILAQGVAAGFFVATAVWLAPAAAQHEQQASKTLLPGKGADLTMAKCAICHDITHVTRTRLSRAEWEDNVKVMIARGTPLTPDEAATVIEYLATYYNRDTPPPAASVKEGNGDPVMRLLSANACVACHDVKQKIVGPSFAEIAERYAGDASAANRLATKIKDGGAGAWGPVPMPPHPALTDADLQAIVSW